MTEVNFSLWGWWTDPSIKASKRNPESSSGIRGLLLYDSRARFRKNLIMFTVKANLERSVPSYRIWYEKYPRQKGGCVSERHKSSELWVDMFL